ncbi:DUF2637 domain-containing protein, partial [Streptomyces albidoflavus]
DKHMEGVRITRWLLSPLPTFLLWRRMKLWELRSYEQVIKLEQERLVYQARLRSRFGRAWRRKAPVESLMPLRLARYGVPLAETAPAGLAAAGIEPALLPPAPAPARQELERADRPVAETDPAPAPATSLEKQPADRPAAEAPQERQAPPPEGSPWFAGQQGPVQYEGTYDPQYEPDPQTFAEYQRYQRFAAHEAQEAQAARKAEVQQEAAEEERRDGVQVPAGPGRTRPLGGAPAIPAQREGEEPQESRPAPPQDEAPQVPGGGAIDEETFFAAFRRYVEIDGNYPNARRFGLYLLDHHQVANESGGPLPEAELRPYLNECRRRYEQEQAQAAPEPDFTSA